MPRLKLTPREKYVFQFDIAIRTTDLNYGGHLGNDKLLSLIHEARVAFLKSYGFTERDCGGCSIILADTSVVYKGEGYAGDVLRFEVAAGEPSRCGFRLFYRVTRTSDGQLIALVENGIVCFDYDTRETQSLPDVVLDICDQNEFNLKHI